MKRIIAVAMLIIIVATMSIPIAFAEVLNDAPSRVINLVYDDSGSMIVTHENKVDTWCQAKYAMEVFAAMLGNKDSMSIYYMSDFEKNTNNGPKLKLNGQDTAISNVDKIHSLVTKAGNTPFNTVRKAYADLQSAEADEKWLVILTDGAFQGIDNVSAFLNQKVDNVRVMFLGMGSDAEEISSDESKSIFYVKAQNSKEILSKITGISTRIFNRDKLAVSSSTNKFSFDIPMAELIVFAQGNNVSIDGISQEGGSVVKPNGETVSVKYSEKPATNYPDFIVDQSLQGCIATFKGNFTEGDYKVNVSNAETVEVYYKPNIEIAAYLKDSNGNEVTDLSDLEAGEYTIEFGFVKGGTKERISNSKLLGNVKYEATVTNNGITHDKTYASGDKISIEEGDLKIDVSGHYLDYNSVTTHLDYSIFKDKTITFQRLDDSLYVVEDNGFVENTPMKIQMLADGKEITEEQWANVEIPIAKIEGSHEFKLDDFLVEKSDEIGIFNVTPKIKDGKPSSGTYSNCDFIIEYDGKIGNESWAGNSKLPIKMQDNRSWFVRNKDRIIKAIILLILLIILLGYMPFVKHYLPRSLKSKPKIECMPNIPGQIPKDVSGRFQKNISSTLIPYKPETGTIKFVPSGVAGVPKLIVKGIKQHRMAITNIRAFENKQYITFNGDYIENNYPKRVLETSAGITICVNKNDWTYTCQPNQ